MPFQIVRNDMVVYLVVFDEKSFELSGELFGGIDSYITQNYVEEKEEDEYPTAWGRDFIGAAGRIRK